MAINSRSKGNKAERMAAAVFTEWTGRPFSRTPSSGGLNWKSQNVKGDIVCTKEGHYFPFCVEIKHHNRIDFNELLLNKKNRKVVSFWEQCLNDAKRANKVPLLLFRYNNLPKDYWFVAIDMRFHALIKGYLKDSPLITINSQPYGKEAPLKLAIMPSSAFFSTPYKEIKKLIKSHGKKT